MTDQSLRFAIVDDDHEDIFVLKRALASSTLNASIDIYHSGEELLEGIEAGKIAPYDLLLLDINMPRVTGFDVLKSLRETPEWRDVFVQVLTTSSNSMDRDKCLRLGANGFVTKFSTISELRGWVSSLENSFSATDT